MNLPKNKIPITPTGIMGNIKIKTPGIAANPTPDTQGIRSGGKREGEWDVKFDYHKSIVSYTHKKYSVKCHKFNITFGRDGASN
jgi:hypothetical protein